MKSKCTLLRLGGALALALMFAGGCGEQTKSEPSESSLFDTKADGAQLIAKELDTAQKYRKRLLVVFGANWCVWCHRLFDLLTTDAEVAPHFQKYFVLVLVDVNKKDGPPRNVEVLQRYGNVASNGIPALVLLERDGKVLATPDSAAFESGEHYDREKVMKFLKEWTLEKSWEKAAARPAAK